MPNIEFSPQAETFFKVVAGIAPPELNTDAASVVSGELDRAGAKVAALPQQVMALVNRAQTGMSGEMSAAFAASLTQYAKNVMPAVAAQLRATAQSVTETGEQAQVVKIQGLVTITQLIVQLMTDALFAIFSPVAALEAAAAAWAAARAFLRSLLSSFGVKVVEMVGVGVAIQVLTDMVTQAVLLASGIQKDWNWSEFGESFGIGALGGAMGVVMGPAEEGLAGAMAGLLKGRLPQVVDDGAAEALGNELGNELGDGVGRGAGDGVGEGLGAEAGEPGEDGADVAVPAASAPDSAPAVEPVPEEAVPAAVAPDGAPAMDAVPGDAVPAEAAEPAPGSAAWLADHLSEFVASLAVGGFHNAGHAFLWNLMTTGTAEWDWGAFAGGATQSVTRSVGVGIEGAVQAARAGGALPAEDLLSLLGPVTPEVLTEIAAARPAEALPAGAVTAGALPGQELSAEAVPGQELPAEALPGGGLAGDGRLGGPVLAPEDEAFSPAVAALRLAGVAPGQDTAYAIALRTGFVPVTGPVASHPDYGAPVIADLNGLAPGRVGAIRALPALDTAIPIPVTGDVRTPAESLPVPETGPRVTPVTEPAQTQPTMSQVPRGRPVGGASRAGPGSGGGVAGGPDSGDPGRAGRASGDAGPGGTVPGWPGCDACGAGRQRVRGCPGWHPRGRAASAGTRRDDHAGSG